MTTGKADALVACFLALALLVTAAATVDIALTRAAMVVFLAFVVAVAVWVAPIFWARLRRDLVAWWRTRRRLSRMGGTDAPR